jgi:hypothetical protein
MLGLKNYFTVTDLAIYVPVFINNTVS